MKTNLSELWLRRGNMTGKLRKMYQEEFLVFISKYYEGNQDEKGGACGKTVGNDRSIKALFRNLD